MISRSIYNLNIDTVYTYDTPIESAFRQLSNGIRHVMPSTDRRLELKAKDTDGSDRLTAGCVLIDLASPAVSRTAVYANGLKELHFMVVAEIEEPVTGELKKVHKKEFSAAFQKLYYCAKACIYASGSYFEFKKKGTSSSCVFDF